MSPRLSLARTLLSSFALGMLLLVLVPSVAAADCTRTQTEGYLADGTSHVFTQKPVDYIIVIDRSGSMAGEKLDTVKRAAHLLISKLGPDDRAAIISFNYEASLDQSLTRDHAALSAAVDNIKASFGTQYTPAMRLAQRQLSISTHDRAFIFLSDGTSDFSETPEQINTLASGIARQGACIMTISYALEGDESAALVAMADIGKSFGCGEHYAASEKGTELEQVFSSIRDRLTSTDIIAITPHLTDATYRFSYASTLNNKSVPGGDTSGCVEEPQISLQLARNGRTYTTLNASNGTFSLPEGTYTYSARASVLCNGDCSFSGAREGVITIGKGCAPSYAQLSAYVTGSSNMMRITARGFEPKTMSVRQGTTLVWNNTDTLSHTIVSPYFNETIPPGGLFAYRIQNVGSFLFTDETTHIPASIDALTVPGSDIMLVVDESGSMAGAPLLEARSAAQQFYETLAPGDRAGLITFAQSAHLVQDFTTDTSELIAATTKMYAEGSTSYLSALGVAEGLRPTQRPILVFMSDGEPTDTNRTADIDAYTSRLRAKGWCIMTIGFGTGGSQARSTLAHMAGTDACAAFIYAGQGGLQTAFGTVYQLLAHTDDLVFTDTSVLPITFGSTVTVSTRVSTTHGAPVPGGTEICSPEALVQASSMLSSTTLAYENNKYSGTITVPYGASTVVLLASVASLEAPSQPLIGRTTRTVVALPFWTLWILIGLILLFATLFAFRKRGTPSSSQKTTSEQGGNQ